MDLERQKLYGVDAFLLSSSNHIKKYKIKCETQDSSMKIYHLFPGIDYALTSFNSFTCSKREKTLSNVVEISYCKTGRFECEYKKDFLTYVGEGDFAISILNKQVDEPTFPLGIYKGFAIIIDLDITGEIFEGIVEGVSINLAQLIKKFCPDNQCTVIKTPIELLHVFNELYEYSNDNKSGYLRLKVLEIFFLLSEFMPEARFNTSKYFAREYIKKVKAIRNEITGQLSEKIYLKDLAKRYDMSLTVMKDCFKEIYGIPIQRFRREYKMQKACQLLKETDKSIIEIANEMGYDNPNKFSTAFKNIIGNTPSEYKAKNNGFLDRL